jgi:hypothetical protein
MDIPDDRRKTGIPPCFRWVPISSLRIFVAKSWKIISTDNQILQGFTKRNIRLPTMKEVMELFGDLVERFVQIFLRDVNHGEKTQL